MKIKVLIVSLFLILYSLFFIRSASAQGPNSNTYLNTNPDVPRTLHTYTQSVFIEIAATLSCQLSGIDPTNPTGRCLGIDPITNKIGFVEGGGGAIGLTGNFIAATFYIPVNTHDYVSNLASNFGIAKKTYAQEGIGFNGLRPTLKLWTAFRNITYMLFVILFVVVGLGIMFRIKIDPRTVMSLQNQIPKIIIAIVLVTFSYAIAGFLIDLMYVTLYLAISLFAEQGLDIVNIAATNPFDATGGIGGMSGIAFGSAKSISGIVASIFDGTLGKVLGAIIGGIIGKTIGGFGSGIPVVGGFINAGATIAGIGLGVLGGSKIVGWVAGIIAYLVIIIALFSALLKLWFVLIKSYIYILITVVFAPFYIAYGLIPGKSGFGNWIKSMVANLAVYPVTIVMLLLGKAFIDGFSKGTAGNPPFVPPMVGDWASPERFGSIIGLAIILMLPEVANMVRDTLKAPELKYSAAIGKGLGTGAAMAGAIPKNVAGQFFGTDRMGRPKRGTAWVSKKFGRLLGGFAGGKDMARPEGDTTPLVNIGFSPRNITKGLPIIRNLRNARANTLRQQRAARGTPPGGLRGGQGPGQPWTPHENTFDANRNLINNAGGQPVRNNGQEEAPQQNIPHDQPVQTTDEEHREVTEEEIAQEEERQQQNQEGGGGGGNPQNKTTEEIIQRIEQLHRVVDRLSQQTQANARAELEAHEAERRRRNQTQH